MVDPDFVPTIFGGNTGVSYAELKMRHELAKEITKRAFPKTFGEGLTYLGESINDIAERNAMMNMYRKVAANEAGIRGGAPRDNYIPDSTGSPAAGAPSVGTPAIPAGPTTIGTAQSYGAVPAAASPFPKPVLPQNRVRMVEVPTPQGSVPVGTFNRENPDADLAQPVPAGNAATTAPDDSPPPDNTGGGDNAQDAGGGSPPSDDGRNAIAKIIADRMSLAAPGVPQPNPTEAGDQTPADTSGQFRTPTLSGATPAGSTIAQTQVPTGATRAGTTNTNDLVPGSGPPIPSDIQPAPDLLPSQQPIPQYVPQVMKPPGERPVQPPMLGPSRAMQYWSQFIDNPNVSPTLQQHALRQYQLGDAYRKELESRQQANYVNQRDIWQRKSDDYDKFLMTANERDIKALTDLQGIEKTRADIKEAAFRLGNLLPQEAEKNRLGILQQQQDVQAGKAPPTQEFDGQRLVWDQGAGRWVKPQLPTVDPADVPLNEKQSNTIKFLQRAYFANQHLGQNDAVLARFWDNNLGNTPVVGNYFRSPQYRATLPFQMVWGQAVLRDESGAALGNKEISDKLSTYFPQPGDDKATIAAKAQLRRNEEQSLSDTLGKAKPVFDRFLQDRQERRVPAEDRGKFKEGALYKNSKGETRVYRGGFLEDPVHGE